MARVDKTDSAVGVVRGVLAADLVMDDVEDSVIGVGINSTGQVVVGAGQTGIIGVMNPSRFFAKAGRPVDVFKLADIVDIGLGANDPSLDAGKAVYADNTTGELSHTAAGGTLVGFTVEEDRLIVAVGDGAGSGGASITPQAAPAVDDTPADATAVATDLASVVAALVAAGVFTEGA